MLRAYEGYFEKGRFYPIGAPMSIEGRRRAIVTILDEPAEGKADTWSELDKIVSEMQEKPHLEDFTRCKLGREPVNFEEV